MSRPLGFCLDWVRAAGRVAWRRYGPKDPAAPKPRVVPDIHLDCPRRGCDGFESLIEGVDMPIFKCPMYPTVDAVMFGPLIDCALIEAVNNPEMP